MSFKWKKNDLAGIDEISITIIINLVINILSLKWFDNFVKYDDLTEKIQTLERLTINKIPVIERLTIDKIQALEILLIRYKP